MNIEKGSENMRIDPPAWNMGDPPDWKIGDPPDRGIDPPDWNIGEEPPNW